MYVQSSMQSWTLNGLKTYHVNGKRNVGKRHCEWERGAF